MDKIPAEIFSSPMVTALDALSSDIDLVIGSSFGGALLGQVVEQGSWKGPCIFLASAHVKFGTLSNFVGSSICIHGLRDSVIPSEPVKAFVEACGKPHEFWSTDDDHRLDSIRDSGMLAKAIETLTK